MRARRYLLCIASLVLLAPPRWFYCYGEQSILSPAKIGHPPSQHEETMKRSTKLIAAVLLFTFGAAIAVAQNG